MRRWDGRGEKTSDLSWRDGNIKKKQMRTAYIHTYMPSGRWPGCAAPTAPPHLSNSLGLSDLAVAKGGRPPAGKFVASSTLPEARNVSTNPLRRCLAAVALAPVLSAAFWGVGTWVRGYVGTEDLDPARGTGGGRQSSEGVVAFFFLRAW